MHDWGCLFWTTSGWWSIFGEHAKFVLYRVRVKLCHVWEKVDGRRRSCVHYKFYKPFFCFISLIRRMKKTENHAHHRASFSSWMEHVLFLSQKWKYIIDSPHTHILYSHSIPYHVPRTFFSLSFLLNGNQNEKRK